MKTQIGVVLAMVVVSFGKMDAKTSTLSGWVSDESCGRAHIKPGKESCVAKCLRGGASVGHPEWLPQRIVLVSDDGKTHGSWRIQTPSSTRQGSTFLSTRNLARTLTAFASCDFAPSDRRPALTEPEAVSSCRHLTEARGGSTAIPRMPSWGTEKEER